MFTYRRTFYLYIHMYAVLWSITVCSDGTDVAEISPGEIASRLAARGIGGLKAYSPQTHHSMLGEFPFIGELLGDLHAVPVITDGSPVVLDDVDINRGSLELREVSAAKPKAAATAKPVATTKAKATAKPKATAKATVTAKPKAKAKAKAKAKTAANAGKRR